MNSYFETSLGKLYHGDALSVLQSLPDQSVNCCVTSPPYFGLRDYGVEGQIGLEKTPDEFVAKLVEVFREVWRVLRDDGTCWVNLGDSYNAAGRDGHGTRIGAKQGTNRASANGFDLNRPSADNLKPKDLIGIPWRVAFALQADGWYLRQDTIWHKPNPMPESVTDRCTKSHEYVFLLSKSARYYYDHEAVKEKADPKNYRKNPSVRAVPPGKTKNGKLDTKRGEVFCETRNRRSVWTIEEDEYAQFLQWKEDHAQDKTDVWSIAAKPFKGAHFACFPPKLIEPCILAGCPVGGVVLDPFVGSGTTMLVAKQFGRKSIGIELSQKYIDGIIVPRLTVADQVQDDIFS